MAMFQNPIAPKPDPAGQKVRQPFKSQPSYDAKKQMFPSGDYYGTGFKAKVGSMRASPSDSPIPKKAMRQAPKSLA
jgi:hypothetical protein